jgi:hypothetical protein
VEQPGHLVEGLAGRIIVAAAKPGINPWSIDPEKFGMTATHQQHQIGPRRQRIPQLDRTEMALKVMHP